MPESVAEYQQCWGFIVSMETEVDLAKTQENMNQITADRIQFIGLKYWAATSRLHKYIMLISSYKTFRGGAECCFQEVWARRGSGRRVEQLLDHLLHLLWAIFMIFLWVLGEGDVGTSGGNTNNSQNAEHWLAKSCIELYLTVYNLVRAVLTSFYGQKLNERKYEVTVMMMAKYN